MKGSIVIVLFFVLGCVLGRLDLVRFPFTGLDYYVLCFLMFFVGMSIGINPDMVRNFRSLNIRVLLLPLATIVGTLCATTLYCVITHAISVTDGLSVGSGFGYYSLSSIFITEYKGVELGTIALIANIVRELITLLCAPFIVRWFGPLALISCGGATTMDTTLPVIMRYSGDKYVPVSLYHGFLVDFSVPFLVTFFCSLPV